MKFEWSTQALEQWYPQIHCLIGPASDQLPTADFYKQAWTLQQDLERIIEGDARNAPADSDWDELQASLTQLKDLLRATLQALQDYDLFAPDELYDRMYDAKVILRELAAAMQRLYYYPSFANQLIARDDVELEQILPCLQTSTPLGIKAFRV